MRILVVDDEPLALDRLRAAILPIEGIERVDTARDGDEALERIAEMRPDLVILDVQMPGQSGIDVARVLAASDDPPDIIFVTAFDRYATEAFEVEAVDYLLKPVSFDRLRLAIQRARRRGALRDAQGRAAELDMVVRALRADARAPLVEQAAGTRPVYENGIWVPCKRGAIRVAVESIDWIEAARDYVLLNTPVKSHIMRATMNEIEAMLDPALLLRIHRSYIVRLGAVVRVERPGKGALRLLLSDGANLQVGPSYHGTVLEALQIGAVPMRSDEAVSG
ncbi:MAG: LytTR family DNA-binding domain-containing protein [Sphingobium sp.]